ncbi:MAG: hypothetical protein OEX22_01425 [Cyclobacteriaceae bacterium]|nr:hypothetical protein [Cyclobacteriaceae bacterium]
MEEPSNNLRQAFGKVIYAVAKIDGEVQQVEIDVFKKEIANHEWAKEISLSFEEERVLNTNPNIVFLKAMKVFRSNGPSEHYPFFIDLLEKIADAHEGIVDEEEKMIKRFKESLLDNLNS